MNATRMLLTGTALLGAAVVFQVAHTAQGAGAQEHKRIFITRLYTGPDGQTHAEEIDAKFSPAGGNDVYKLMATAGAELHRQMLEPVLAYGIDLVFCCGPLTSGR